MVPIAFLFLDGIKFNIVIRNSNLMRELFLVKYVLGVEPRGIQMKNDFYFIMITQMIHAFEFHYFDIYFHFTTAVAMVIECFHQFTD